MNDRELLAKTLQAEAGNQGLGGMLAVGSVIRNRMQQGGSLSDVILAPAQFSAWNKVTGAAGGEQGQDMAALKPSEDAYAAADAILTGNAPDVTGGATHYYNPSISQPDWGKEKAGGDWTKIGAHIFGKAGDFRTGAAKMNGTQTPPMQMFQEQQPQQKPRGLLGGLDQDFAEKLYIAALAGSPNAAQFAPLVQGVMQRGKERRAVARTTAQANATADYLERIGQTDLANLLRQGGIDARTALSAGGKDTALIRQAIAAGLKPNTPEFRKYILSGGDIYGAGAPVEFGPLEKGTMLVQGRDEQGNITYQVQPISGSQAEKDAKKAADVITKQTEAKVTSGTTVLGDISEMKRKIEANPTLTTGMIGSLLLRMGFTTAVDVNELGETIRSNIGFDRLQRMREESPTGGALGQVAVQELNALQASLGSLKTSQSDDQLIRNLERLEKQYQQSMRRILETEGGSEYFTQNEISEILGTKPSNNQGSQPDFSTMSDAELNAWIEENS